jgi:hypothetical protein
MIPTKSSFVPSESICIFGRLRADKKLSAERKTYRRQDLANV